MVFSQYVVCFIMIGHSGRDECTMSARGRSAVACALPSWSRVAANLSAEQFHLLCPMLDTPVSGYR